MYSLKIIAYILTLFLGCYSVCLGQSAKPNILIIMTDQHSHSAMSNTGNPWLKTPAMDAIAANGIRFSRAYVTQPLCNPFRTSMQVGKYPHETGVVINNAGQATGDFKVMGKAMSEAGYETAYYGKWHVGYSGSDNYQTFAGGSDIQSRDNAVNFLKKSRTKPFFLTVSFTMPHPVADLARALRDGNPTGAVRAGVGPFPGLEDLPPLPANHEIPEDQPDVVLDVMDMYRERTYPTENWNELTWRQYLWGYYRFVERADGYIGTVMKALKDSGEEENTVVLFTSDHGEGMAAHLWTSKQVLYDESVRVPFIMSYKGKSPTGIVDSAHLISTGLDIYPTLLDLAGAEIPAHFDGKSIKPLLMGEDVSDWRDHVIAETRFAMPNDWSGVSSLMVVTSDHKYISYNRDGKTAGDQFFDLNQDPGEKYSLTEDEAYVIEVNRHKNLLKDWQTATNETEYLVPNTQYVEPTSLENVDSYGLNTFSIKGNGVVRTISFPAMELTEIRILNIKGNVVKRLTPTHSYLHTAELSGAGIYIAQFISSDKNVERIFIK